MDFKRMKDMVRFAHENAEYLSRNTFGGQPVGVFKVRSMTEDAGYAVFQTPNGQLLLQYLAYTGNGKRGWGWLVPTSTQCAAMTRFYDIYVDIERMNFENRMRQIYRELEEENIP